MRLILLELRDFRRFEQLNVDLARDGAHALDGQLDFFVGVNGSGKSTALEALAVVFGHLAVGATPGFGFTIEYVIGDTLVRVESDPGGRRAVWADGEELTDSTMPPNLLPARIVGYSAGPGRGLQDALTVAMERALLDEANLDEAAEAGTTPSELKRLLIEHAETLATERRATLGTRPALFLGDDDAVCAVLPLLVHHEAARAEERERRRDVLERVNLDVETPALAFTVRVRPGRFGLLDPVNEERLRGFLEVARPRVAVEPEVADEEAATELYAVFDAAADTTRGRVRDVWTTPLAMCEDLAAWRSAGAIVDIAIVVRKVGVEDALVHGALSDGESLYLARIGLLIMLADVGESLVLLDEPDTHFNDAWKEHLVHDVHDALPATAGGHQVVVATHSDLTLTDAEREEVHLFPATGLRRATADRPPIAPLAANRTQLSRMLWGAGPVGEWAKHRVGEAIDREDRDELVELLDQLGPGPHRFHVRELLYELLDREAEGSTRAP